MLSPQPVTSHHFFALCKPMLLRKSSRIQRRQHQQKEGHGSVHVDVTSKLPDVSPYLVLPPTPSSPDDLLAGQTLVDWRVQDENVNTKKNLARHEKVPTYRPKSRLGLGLTGLTSKADKLPPSPVSVTLSDHQDARDEPPQAAQQISFDRIIASGHPLHPFLLNNYSILEELGAGGYGVVVRAMRMEDMREVAIKIVWRCKMPNDSWVAVTGWEDKLLSTPVVVSREAHILRQICHPGVISYIDYFEDHTFVYLVSRLKFLFATTSADRQRPQQ